MPPPRWLKRPAWANPQAMAIEPSAVTIHESREMAPTLAMLVGSMMMPEPIMFTATMNVSWTRLIFLVASATAPPLVTRLIVGSGLLFRSGSRCDRSRRALRFLPLPSRIRGTCARTPAACAGT